MRQWCVPKSVRRCVKERVIDATCAGQNIPTGWSIILRCCVLQPDPEIQKSGPHGILRLAVADRHAPDRACMEVDIIPDAQAFQHLS
jgi:hypothetical protein